MALIFPDMQVIDLRSDTVTQPSAAMRAAMAAAPVGDDVFGDDPSVNALQDKLASMLGFDAALFMPTGTQSNLCAILAHCQRGDEYIVGQYAHCYRWEGGGAAVMGSVQPQPLSHQPNGMLAWADIEAAIKPDDAHFAKTRLLALENTLGGKLLPFDDMQQVTEFAKRQGLARHLDGARLFNAATAQAVLLASYCKENEPVALINQAQAAINNIVNKVTAKDIECQARRIAQCFDSVSVCLSKGLGAPVGSVLCGSRELISRAHRIRKMAGGGMRQAGILAAAGLYALEHHVERLDEDHAMAQDLAAGLQGLPGVLVEPPQSNMVFVDLHGAAKDRAPELLTYLKSRGVLATGLYRLRFVTHLDVDGAGIQRAVAAFRLFFEGGTEPA